MPNLKREMSFNDEVATIATLIAVGVDSGLSVSAAIESAVSEMRGMVADRFRKVIKALDLGENLADELGLMRQFSNGALSELLVKLQIALEFGSPVSDQLMQFASSVRATINHQRLALGTKQENAMMLPLVFLILPVSILFALYPSIQFLNLNY